MGSSLYRPDRPSYRRLLIGASLAMIAWGICYSVAGGTVLLIAGLILTVGATSNLIAVLYLYPRGFQMPEGIDPEDRPAVRAAVVHQRRGRRLR